MFYQRMHCRTTLFIALVLLSLYSSVLLSDDTRDRRVIISASIFPRIVAVDLDLAQKLDASKNVRLGLIYVSNKLAAEKIARLMTRNIKNIAGNNIVIELINVTEFDFGNLGRLTGLFFVQRVSAEQLKKISLYSKQFNVLTFSPFEGDIERGVMASIFVGAKIRPYFNLASLSRAGVNLKSALIRVSKTYE